MAGCNGCAFKGMSTAVESAFVGVRFREETNLTLCSTGGRIYARGEKVVVDLESGPAFGCVEQSPMPVFKPCQKSSARPILRPADAGDLAAYDRQRQSELSGKLFAQERARALNLDMKISLVDFSLNRFEQKNMFLPPRAVNLRRGCTIFIDRRHAGLGLEKRQRKLLPFFETDGKIASGDAIMPAGMFGVREDGADVI